MPELPEVRTVSKHLNKRLKGMKLKKVDVRLPKIVKDISVKEFKSRLKGQTLLKVENEGKWIVFNFSNFNNVIVHLRLEGKFRTNEVEGIKTKHDHVVMTFDKTTLYFNDTRQFGTFHLKGKEYINEKPLVTLGRSLKDLDIDWLYERLSKKRIPIKSAMLDQTLVVGLGNIYINEALWFSKINPNTPSKEVSKKKLKELIEISHKIMEESYKDGGSSISTYSSLDGVKGEYQNKLEVHGFKDKPCNRCKTPLIKTKVGGRGTYWCEKCQK